MFLYLRGNKLRENEASRNVCSLLPFSNELYSCFSTRGFPDPWRQLDAVAMGAGYGPALPCSSEASIRPGVYKSLQGLAEMLPCSLFPLCFYFGFAKRPPQGRERCSRRAQLRGWQQPGSRWAITATPRAGHTSPCHMGSSAFDSKMTEEGMRNTARARRWEGSDARRAAAGNRSVTSRAWGSKRQTWGPLGTQPPPACAPSLQVSHRNAVVPFGAMVARCPHGTAGRHVPGAGVSVGFWRSGLICTSLQHRTDLFFLQNYFFKMQQALLFPLLSLCAGRLPKQMV